LQFIVPNGGRRDITTPGARRLIQDIGNGPFNPKSYPCFKTDKSKAVHTVEVLRDGVLKAFDKAVALMSGTRVEEISELAGAAPAGITGVAVDTSDEEDDAPQGTAIVKFQRDQQALIVRRLNAEITEREANANAQNATAELTQLQITHEQQRDVLIKSRLSSEAEAATLLIKKAGAEVEAAAHLIKKADAEVRKADAEAKKADAEAKKADAEAKKADAEAQAAQQEVDRARAEQLQKEADAKHARKMEAEKLKREAEHAAEAVQDKCRKRIRELETQLIAAPTLVETLADRNELADLYVKIKRYSTSKSARGQATKVWKDAHPPAEPPKKRRRTDVVDEPVPAAPPPPQPVNPQRTVYVRVGVNCPQQYVGRTENHDRRTQQHDGGVAAGGAVVVQRFNLSNEVDPITPAREDLKAWENEETLMRMTLYGLDNVFGGKYAAPYRSAEKRLRAIADCCDAFDLCNRCARNGHMFTRCRETTYADWTGGGIITKPITD
jgi:hypothetical protein